LARLSKIWVEAQCGNCDRSAHPVVSGVVDVLDVKGGEHTPPDGDCIETFEDLFRAVGKSAITEQKAQTSQVERLAAYGRDPVDDEGHTGTAPRTMTVAPLANCSRLR